CPEVERPVLAGVPVGDVVVLAAPRRVAAAAPQHPGDRDAAPGQERVVAGEARAELHAVAGGATVGVAAGGGAGPGWGGRGRAGERGPGGWAERRRVHAVVLQAVGRQPVEVRRTNATGRSSTSRRPRSRRSGPTSSGDYSCCGPRRLLSRLGPPASSLRSPH